ncbi:DUF4145 domain-containing protein [Candidimonas humi]|uniref:DUF4145 domain-containing protein n=1 Tax=Candidimonas humi TaxID=683355 RepID=A0ABV8NUJ7_9BURK|nr:DUF4145 domain-containing protein [Candidimonas humi]MBV6304924.1 DUF4145 domain-containing protein [Candidimonas humi]
MNPTNSAVPPKFYGKGFTCPLCHAYAQIGWSTLSAGGSWTPFLISMCAHCKGRMVWLANKDETDGRLIFPSTSTAPPRHPDLPEICHADYDEAKDVVDRSPRGAGALLRLCLEKLCAHLTGTPNKSINENIASLVAGGLPARIQQSLDYLRVIGNCAVHPGNIDLNDSPEMVHSMFELINIIVENQITQPRAIEALYGQLPAGAREAVEKRDA